MKKFAPPMQIIAKGKPYPVNIKFSGPRLMFRPSMIEVVVPVAGPDAYEVKSFKAGHPTKIGVARIARLGVLLVDFGEGFCFDVPFDAGIESPINIPAFSGLTPTSRITISLTGVDPMRKNSVFGLRKTTMSARVSHHLANQISDQLRSPTDIASHATAVATMHQRYPSYESLEEVILALDPAGVDSVVPTQKTNGTDSASASRNSNSIHTAIKLNEIHISAHELFARIARPRPYPRPLPADLACWHCYIVDSGHSILCLAEKQTDEPALGDKALLPFSARLDGRRYDPTMILDGDTRSINEWLIPIPVKTVMRGYRTVRDYVVANVEYDPSIGVITDPEDNEY